MDGGRDERQVECACGFTADRLPFSGVPYLKGETVVSSIPDPVYRYEAERRQFNDTWGTAERSLEMIRKNVTTDKEGRKFVNTKAMSEPNA
jgi:hypothetical protein